MAETIKGTCICESVEFQVADNFKTFKLCHCDFCKKASGSAHVANAFGNPEDLEWTKGQGNLQSYDVPNSQVRRVFCKSCGTSLPFISQNGLHLIVPVGSLSKQPSLPPQAIASWDQRMPWYDLAMLLPTGKNAD